MAFKDIDIRKLSELDAPERAFLSVYISSPETAARLPGEFSRLRRCLSGKGACASGNVPKTAPDEISADDEKIYFDENVRLLNEYLEKHKLKKGGIAIFACWAIDFFAAYPLDAPLPDIIWVDSSPYVRPLAELADEYENVAVVIADNSRARVYLVSSLAAQDETTLKGNVKNHVKKGGWSQQRYERRRDKQILHYARDIVDALAELDRKEDFRRIVLVGGKEILAAVEEDLPKHLAAMVARKAVDLSKGEGDIEREIWELFAEQERESERGLWDRIRDAYLAGGRGAVGAEDVLAAVEEGRAHEIIVIRGFAPPGRRCRDCGKLSPGEPATCPACGSESVFAVDLVEEIVEIAHKTGAPVDFSDPIETLAESGSIAALLRY